MTRDRFTWLGAVSALIVLAADQASKWWILNGLDLPARGPVRLLPVLNFDDGVEPRRNVRLVEWAWSMEHALLWSSWPSPS